MGTSRRREEKRRRRQARRRKAERERKRPPSAQGPTIRELLQRAIEAADPQDVLAFKMRSPILAYVFVCLELGAASDSEEYASKALRRSFEHASQHARQSGENAIHVERLFPFLDDPATSAIVRAVRLAQRRGLWDQARAAAPKGPLADITLAYHSDETTPVGYSRIIARDGDRVVFDRVLDPVEAPDVVVRITHGDPALVGKVPLIGIDVSEAEAREHARQTREKAARAEGKSDADPLDDPLRDMESFDKLNAYQVATARSLVVRLREVTEDWTTLFAPAMFTSMDPASQELELCFMWEFDHPRDGEMLLVYVSPQSSCFVYMSPPGWDNPLDQSSEPSAELGTDFWALIERLAQPVQVH